MLTKEDFLTRIAESITAYPAIAPLYHAEDPRILQPLMAMASMLSLLSAQQEVAMAEPFEKVRAATVLADAAMRGIVRKGTAARAQIKARNQGTTAFSIETGRVLLDSAGRPWRVETPVVVPAQGEGLFEALQIRSSSITHRVAGSYPFYAIEIPAADDDGYLAGLSVSDASGAFAYRARYVNTLAGERVYHVEADDRQRVYVRFGYDGVVATQPVDGDEIVLEVFYTAGEVTPEYESPFAFSYIASPLEAVVELQMERLLVAGQNPISMAVLSDLARYPSVYDDNAVFLGEFDFLVRRHFPSLQFLSVWNETTEERVRGANLESMNALFVACLSATGDEALRVETDPGTPVAPEIIDDEALTATQIQIRQKIAEADDSYRVRFVTPVRSPISLSIQATVATSYVASSVAEQIRALILSEFGEAAAAARRGRNKPLYARVYELLRKQVAALSTGGADFKVQIDDSAVLRPELWRYVAPESLMVTVQTANVITPAWGG